MGTMIGNIISLIIILATALLSFISLKISAISFIAVAYLAWLLIFISNFFTKPSKNSNIYKVLSQKEFESYQKYHLHFWFPSAAQAYSALMNSFRTAGFIWAGVYFWNSMHWLGGASIAYFFITGGLILKLNPYLYMGGHAQKGNQTAIEELSLIERVQEKLNTEQKA